MIRLSKIPKFLISNQCYNQNLSGAVDSYKRIYREHREHRSFFYNESAKKNIVRNLIEKLKSGFPPSSSSVPEITSVCFASDDVTYAYINFLKTLQFLTEEFFIGVKAGTSNTLRWPSS